MLNIVSEVIASKCSSCINLSAIFIPCCPCIFLKSYGTKDLENNCRCFSNFCFPPQHEWNGHSSLLCSIYSCLEYCSAVWCDSGASPALLKDLEKVQLRVARAIARNPTLQDVSTLALQLARLPTLSWGRREHCLGLLWQLYCQRSSCTTGHIGALCTATVNSLSSLFSFSFCFIVPSLVVLSLSNCPHLEQVAFFCHLFCVSLFFSVSGLRLLCLGYVQLRSLLVLFSHSFRRLPHFYLYFCLYIIIYVPRTVFLPCFLLLYFFSVCCCCFILPEERPQISIMLLANPL